jgi:tRNA A-37 threonylcarbamoyl transferase component Bud32
MERDDLTVFPNSGLPSPSSAPSQIGTYRILREIGRGGMGAVYEALQAQPQRRVALKLIRADQMSEELLRRFSIEVQALGRLGHAGIARIYEGGTTDTSSGSQPYFVMELVDGLPLDEYVSTRRIGIRDCVTLIATVAEAVHHAHQQDVIHRDLKPANILVDKTGQPKILDFGVARMVGTERLSAAVPTHTQLGAIVGTLQYMSPEQAEGDPDHFDQRSDVYALGVILYKLLAGRLPYRFAGGFIDAVSVIHGATPDQLGDIDERLRGDLERVVSRALAKEREHRYQTAQAFADDLRRVVNGRPVSVPGATVGAKLRRWTMREENIRQAGWAGAVGYGLVALFELMWVMIGAIAWFWWPPLLPRDLRYAEFMLNTVVWTLALALLAWVSWRAAHKHPPSMWAALIANAVLTAFTVSVLFFNSYDFGGVVRDPLVRSAVFMLYTMLACLGVVLSAVALLTARRLRQWDRPILLAHAGSATALDAP